MTPEEINKSRIERGLLPLPVLGEVGYKGKGMCGVCAYQGNKVPNTNSYRCVYYGRTCMSVSRNCSGTKSLK